MIYITVLFCTGGMLLWTSIVYSLIFALPDKSIQETMEAAKARSRVQWSIHCSSDGVSFPFDGTPLLSGGTVYFQCHRGKDIDEKRKQMRKRALDEKEVSEYEEIASLLMTSLSITNDSAGMA